MDDLFRNIRDVIGEEIRLGIKNFIIYPFPDVGHLVREILEWDYGRKAIIVDNVLAKYNDSIHTVDFLEEINREDSVVLLSVGNPAGVPYFREILDGYGVRYHDVRERIALIHVPDKTERFKKLKSLLAVKRPKWEQGFTRMGRDNDGGYVMLDDFTSVSKMYSFGISCDVSFEKDMAMRGIECMMYDHTIDRLPEENKLFHWQKKGVAGEDKPEAALYSLESLMKENEDLGKKDLILKMDVEGAEWDFLDNTSLEILDSFKQIVFEFHGVTDTDNKHVLPMLKKLRETHTPVWLHGNNFNVAEMSGNIVFAPSMEVLYLKNSCYDFAGGSVVFPWDLDMPNNPEEPEIVLGECGFIE